MPERAAELAALVLAAGASARMGAPKALLVWRGRTFLRHVVALAEAAGCAPILAVEGAIPLPDAELGPAARVVNPTWPSGQTDSLRRGLAALTRLAPGRPVLVLTVDRPHLAPATVRALADAARAAPSQIWQPEHAGRRGHPIVYPPSLVPALLDLPADATPRDLLRRPEHAALRRTLAVDDPAVLDNLDRPEDLARLP
mgnify:CR=1 FL=1